MAAGNFRAKEIVCIFGMKWDRCTKHSRALDKASGSSGSLKGRRIRVWHHAPRQHMSGGYLQRPCLRSPHRNVNKSQNGSTNIEIAQFSNVRSIPD